MQFFDANGNPLAGGKLYTYAAGTTTPLATYTDQGGLTPNANPILLNAEGKASVWLGSAKYKFVLYNASDVLQDGGGDNIGGLDQLKVELEASSGSSLVGFIQSGAGAVARTAQSKMRDFVSLAEFGATGDGLTDDTSAINLAISAAISSGKALYIPKGTYMTTGGHTITYPGKVRFVGEQRDGVIFKRLSGTVTLFDIEQYAFCSFENMTIDGNNLGGKAFMWRAHYSSLKNMNINNVAGTSYAVHISGSNLCTYDSVDVFNSYGGWLIDNLTDPLVTKPGYGSLYSAWNKCSADIRAASAGSALSIAGSITANLTFNSFYFEYVGAGSTGLGIGIIGTNIYSIIFNSLSCEFIDTGVQIIEITGAGVVYDIRFLNGKFGTAVNRTAAMFIINGVHGFEFSGNFISDTASTAPKTFIFSNCKGAVIENNICSYLNNFTFIRDYTNNASFCERNNTTRTYAPAPGLGTNSWESSTNLYFGPSEFTQSTIVSYFGPASYDATGKMLNTTVAGSYTGTLTGCTTAPTASVKYEMVGNTVTLCLTVQLAGTSNATTKTITGTVPDSIKPSAARVVFVSVSDNGGAFGMGYVSVGTNGTIYLYRDPTGNAWTAAGTATVMPFTVTYIK